MGRDDSRIHPVRVRHIQDLMADRNLSRSELARRADITLKQINNILNQENNPREDTIVRIARVLCVPWRTLCEDYDPKSSEPPPPNAPARPKTVTRIILDAPTGTDADELRRRLNIGLTKRDLDGSHIIEIIILRPDDAI